MKSMLKIKDMDYPAASEIENYKDVDIRTTSSSIKLHQQKDFLVRQIVVLVLLKSFYMREQAYVGLLQSRAIGYVFV